MADEQTTNEAAGGEAAAPAERPVVGARLRRNDIALFVPKVKPLVQAMRSLKVARYDWRNRQWTIPLRKAADAYRALEAAGADVSALASLVGISAIRQVDAEEIIVKFPELFPHQREGVRFLASSRGAILADDMGLGKTRQAIIALGERRPEGNLLVVCPASLKLNWRREIQVVYPDAEVRIINGPDPVVPARWTIINYDLLARKRPEIVANLWSGVIFDEAHYIKNATAARSKAALAIAERIEDCYLLTGTPVMNRPIELFNLLRAIDHPLSVSYIEFGKRYCDGKWDGYGWDFSGASNLDELKARTEGSILARRKEDVLDLPPKLRSEVPVPLDPNKYRELEQQFVGLAQQQRQKYQGNVRWNELLPVMTKLRHAVAKDKAKHTARLVRDALEQGEKAIVFTGFNAVADTLQAEFGPAAVRLTGDTSQKARQEAVDRFQSDPEVRVFVGNILAAGTGITLTAATQVFFNDLDWVPANHLQAEDRAYRIGQNRMVNVYYVSAPGTFDEIVWFVLKRKLAVLDQLDFSQRGSAPESGDARDEILQALLEQFAGFETAASAERWLKEQGKEA